VITWRWLTGKGGDRLRDLAECLRGERATEGEDHARAPGDHVPRGSPGGQECRSRGGLHRCHEVIDRHLGERDPVSVRVADQVEGDVDAAGIRRHGVGVLVDRVLVERVDLRRLGRSPAERICPATLSSFAGVRPARKTRAPSRANARATAPPIDPPPP
jgi:hypothetical protein